MPSRPMTATPRAIRRPAIRWSKRAAADRDSRAVVAIPTQSARPLGERYELPMSLISEADFDAEAIAFLDAHATKRVEERLEWGVGSDEVGVFEEQTPEEER